jgi:hypothetical protein
VSFDQELRRALSRSDPSPGFVDRVLGRLSLSLDSTGTARHRVSLRTQQVRWVAAAVAACLLITVGWGRYEAHRQRAAEAERLTWEIRIALQIASEKLNDAQRRVQQLNEREF